jgi:hypothetical protein
MLEDRVSRRSAIATCALAFTAAACNGSVPARLDAHVQTDAEGPDAYALDAAPSMDAEALDVEVADAALDATADAGIGSPVLTQTRPRSPANENRPHVLGRAAPGLLIALYPDRCLGAVANTATTASDGSFDIVVNVLDDTTTTFFGAAFDAVNNRSPCSTSSVTYVEDSTPPPPPVLVDTVPTSPSRVDTSPLVRGRAEAGAAVRLFVGPCSAMHLAARATASSTGAFSMTATVAPDTSTSFYATATDPAGNTSTCSNELLYVHDSIPPAAPLVLRTSPSLPANNFNTPLIIGTAESASTVGIFGDALCRTFLADGTATSSGAFSIRVSVPDDSVTSFYATARDAAGNVSGCSQSFVTYVEDSTPPTIAITLPSTGDILRAEDEVAADASDDKGLAGVSFFIDAQSAPFSMLGSIGPYNATFDTTTAADGAHRFHAIAVDEAGNAAQATVDVQIDNTPPRFDPTISRPANNALLSQLAANVQLAPATFEFIDADLDLASVQVAVTFRGTTLADGTHYTATRTPPGIIEVAVDQGTLSAFNPSQAGDPLVFVLSNIRDRADTNLVVGSQPNVASNVTISTVYDIRPPQATILAMSDTRNARAFVQFNEPMSASSASSFTFQRTAPTIADIAADPSNGTGLLSRVLPQDTFYFVPAALLDFGATYRIDASSLTDVAGNRAIGTASTSFTVASPPSPIALLRVEILAHGQRTVLATIGASAILPFGLVAPPSMIGTNDDVRLVFDRSLDPARSRATLQSAINAGGCSLDSVPDSSTLADDSLRIVAATTSSCAAAPIVPYPERQPFQIRWDVLSAPGPNVLESSDSRMLLFPSFGDTTPPSVSAIAGRRGTRAVPLIRPDEPLRVGFSELLDPSTVVPPNFAISGPTTAPVALQRGFGLTGEDIQVHSTMPLAPGRYTLTISGVRDLASNGAALQENTITSTAMVFDVGLKTPARSPTVLATSPANGDGLLQSPSILLTFDDTMSAAGFTDSGPTHGFELKEQIGDTFVPLKGLAPQPGNQDAVDTEMVSLAPAPDLAGKVFTDGRSYRLALIAGPSGLLSVDEAPLMQAPPPIFFSTAAPGSQNHRPSLDSASFQLFEQTGVGRPSFDVAVRLFDPDPNDRWSLRLDRAAPPAASIATAYSASMALLLSPAPAQIGPAPTPGTPGVFFVESTDNALFITVSDLAQNTVTLQPTFYAVRSATMVGAAPRATPVSPGAYAFSGAVSDAADGARISEVSVLVVQLDQSGAIARFAYGVMARVDRAADGTLSYAHTMAPDWTLPHLASGSYRAIAALIVPATIARGDDTLAFSIPSSAFNP